MKQEPLISIISGYYNRIEFVEKSIQSLCDQTYQNTEIIIFDDCSTDGTYEKLKVFEAKDRRIKVIRHEKNIGFVSGLISAVNSCNGEFIAIHGSGDYSFPTRIEKQVEVLLKNPKIGVVGCIVENVSLKNGMEIIALFHHQVNGNVTEILEKENIYTHGEVMFRKAVHDEVGGYRKFFTYAQDYDLWTRMSVKCNFSTVQEILYKRYLRSDGATVKPEKRLSQVINTEIIQQNLFFIKQGKPDLVDLYNDDALLHIKKISSRGIRNFWDRLTACYNTYGKINAQGKAAIRKIIFSSDRKILGLMLYFSYVLTPNFIAKKVVNRKKFKNLLSYCYERLP